MYRFRKAWIRLFLTVILCICALPALAKAPRCENCGKKLPEQFLQSKDGRCFCSERCAQEKLWPHCMSCGKAFETGRQMHTVYGQFVFCNACANRPGCFVCDRKLPDMKHFQDGRYLCTTCAKTAVTDLSDARRIYKSVRAELVKMLNFKNDHGIGLNFAPYKRLNPDGPDDGSELGLYAYKGMVYIKEATKKQKKKNLPGTERREDEVCAITVVDSMPKVKFCEVIAHELAHDYMQHRWPYISDLKTKEGFAEAVAAYYNAKTGASNWNVRMENNPDPIYGDGFRMVNEWYKQGGWPEVARRLTAENERNLPPELKAPSEQPAKRKKKSKSR